MLDWANRFSICCFMDSHHYTDTLHEYDCLLAAGAKEIFNPQENILPSLKKFTEKNRQWLFGHINYELKNETEQVVSAKPVRTEFPSAFFFVPEIIIRIKNDTVHITSFSGKEPKIIYDEITHIAPAKEKQAQTVLPLTASHTKNEYTETINKLKSHIQRGDCYEINFCMEFFSDDVEINPAGVYKKLTEISPAPFSCFYKLNDKYLLCSSPERYIKKKGNKIISQPVKGTIKRDLHDGQHDLQLKNELFQSAKDRSENVMVADLVRNDLSRICREGTVHTDELFGIYSFAQVHQMITTISGEVDEQINIADVLKATFPMGSMTGAPKKRVLELIDMYEKTGRGIFSGTVGYISPENNFDFNVVIRSIMYNETKKALSCFAGSGITFYSDPQQEYEECMLKAKAMMQALGI